MENNPRGINNRRILKNTIALYGRMLLSMAMSLYTSRVVLNALGINDYGIYGLIGSIVVLFSFLNSTMSGATSRYLTVELAKNNYTRLHHTFSTALLLHIGIAVIVLILAETIGLWLLLEMLNIPDSRMDAAVWIYQFSILSAFISITQVPYNASLIAHEKMDVFALIEIVNSFLKLLIALFLPIVTCDRLILYGGAILTISFLVAMSYRIYCNKHYSECRGKLIWNRQIGQSMFSFSGWNLYANLCFTSRQQGTNMLLNIFGSTAVNAAAGLATSIQGMIDQVASNLVMASRPQIIKHYAVGHFSDMVRLMKQTTMLANVLYLIVAVPFVAEIHYIMQLWLVQVPPYTIEFCVLMVIASFVSLNNNIMYIGIQAIGRVKLYSFMAGTASLSVIPFLWFLFNNGANLTYAFALPIITNTLIYIICAYTLHNYIKEFVPILHFLQTIVSQVLLSIPSIAFIIFIQQVIEESFYRVVVSITVSSLMLLILSYYLLLPKRTRKDMKNSIMQKMKFNKF